MIDNNVVKVRVKGEYACFTQPALKVERMTYPCMTPSAARGVLECILWKPEFQWVVKSIKILKPISFSSFKRNELSSIQSGAPIYIQEKRCQRISFCGMLSISLRQPFICRRIIYRG